MLLLTLRTAHLAGMSVQGKLSEYNLIVFYRLGGGGSKREVIDEPKVVLDEQERKQMIGGAFAQAMQT